MPQETYSLASLDESVDEDRGPHTRYAPFENMLSAAHAVTALLIAQQSRSNGNHIPAADPAFCYGILGGFSMQLRGGRRSTRDIDIVTSIKMKGVWEALTGADRVVLPDSRLIEGVLKIFVKTGSSWDDCAESHRIEVDVKQAGMHKSPRRIHENVDRVGPFDLFGQAVYFNVLNIASMMRNKVECCLTRAEQRDFEDVAWMVRNHTLIVCKAMQDGVVDVEELGNVLKDARIGGLEQAAELMQLLRSGLELSA